MKFFVFLMILAVSISSQATISTPQTITLDGRLFDSNSLTNPLLDLATLDLYILDSSKVCVLYHERQVINTSTTSGYFNVQLGSSLGDTKRVSGTDPGNTMDQIFQNALPIAANNAGCLTGYTPAAGDLRYVRIMVMPASTGLQEVLSPDVKIDSVPNALTCENVQGVGKSGFLQLGTTADLTQANFNDLFSASKYPKLSALVDGTSTQYMKTSSTGASLPSFGTDPSATTGQMWYDSTNNVVKYFNGSTIETLGAGGGGGGGSPLNNGQIWVGNASNQATGVTMSGDATISNAGALTIATGAINSTKIADGSIGVADLNIAGSMAINSGLLVRDGTQFFNKTCSGNQTLIWTVSNGWSCSNVTLTETDPKVGTNTTNYVSKWDGSALVASGIIESGGNVGIGTATPNYNVHANSSTANSIMQFTNSTTGAASSNGMYLGQLGLASYVVNQEAGDLVFATANTEKMRILANGNVGLGTNSTTFKLDMRNASADTSARVYRTGTGASDVAISAQNGVGYIGSISNNTPLGILVNNSERVRVDTNGNVGIGTTNPLGVLHISSNNSGALFADAYNTAGIGDAWVMRLARGTAASPTAVQTGDQIAFFGTRGYGTSAFSAGSQTSIRAIAAENFTNTAMGTHLSFDTAPVGTTSRVERVRILENGNVGIGTTSPTAKLEVVGTVKATSFEGPMTATTVTSGAGSSSSPSMTFSGDTDTGFYNASSDDTISITNGGTKTFDFTSLGLISPTTGGGYVTNANGTASAPTYSFAGDADTGWFRPSENNLAASTGGSERMRITDTGSIGIGTTSPVHFFHVAQTKTDLSGSNEMSNNLLTVSPTSATTGTFYAGENQVKYTATVDSPSGTIVGGTGQALNSSANRIQVARGLYGQAVNLPSATGTIGQAIGVYGVAGNHGTSTGTVSDARAFYATVGNSSGTVTTGYGLYVGPISSSAKWSLYTADSSAPNYFAGKSYIGSTSSYNVSGLTSPMLQVSQVGDANIGQNTFANSTSTSRLQLSKSRGTAVGDFTAVSSGDPLGTVDFSGSDGTQFVLGSRITASADATPSAGIIPSRLTFSTANASGTQAERLRIDSSGYVGIGTTSPAYKLDVSGSLNATSIYLNGIALSTSGTSSSVATTGGSVQTITQTDTGAASASRSALTLRNNGTGGANEFNLIGQNSSGTTTSYITAGGTGFLSSALYTPIVYGSSASSGNLTLESTSHTTKGNVVIQPNGGNVGIGTTSPTTKLEVNGVVKATSFEGTMVSSGSSNAGGYTINSDTDSSGNDGGINFQVRGATKLAVTDGGRVSVGGASTPASLLANTNTSTNDGAGTGSSVDSLTWLTNAAGYVASFTNTSSATNANGLFVKTTGTASTNRILNLNANGTDVMTVTGQGNVGIGTTVPKERLDLGGIAFHHGGSLGLQFNQYYSAANSRNEFAGYYTSAYSGGIGFSPVSGNLQFSTSPANGALGAASGDLVRMTIDKAGYVGIGTTDPQYMLDLSGRAKLNFVTVGGDAYDSIGTKVVDYAFDYEAIGVSSTGANLRLESSNNIYFHTGMTASEANDYSKTRMTLLSNGNVGIGTTSPGAQLEVLSNTATPITRVHSAQAAGHAPANLQLRRTGAALGTTPNNSILGELRFDGMDATGTPVYMNSGMITVGIGTNAAGGAPSYMSFATAANGAQASERMRIDSNGNVGIGTGAPNFKLTVKPSGTNDGIVTQDLTLNHFLATIPNNGAGNFNPLVQAGDQSFIYSGGAVDSAASGLVIGPWSAVAKGLRMDSAGNVGIGTTTPSKTLHVVGSTMVENSTNTDNRTLNTSDGWTQIALQRNKTSGSYNTEWDIYLPSNSTNLRIANNTYGGDILTATTAGNVGIGTTNPGYKLDVQGGDINVSGSVRSAGIALTSDIRYKRDIEPLDNALEKILNIRGVSYNWRTEEFPQKHFNDRHQIGVIAQEVEAQFPEVVDTNKDGYKSVNYPALVAPLIEAVKTLYNRLIGVEATQINQAREIASKADKAEMEALKAKNQKLEQENAEMKTRLDKIEKMLNSK